MNISFEKEDDGKWYAIIPEWPYAHEEFEMVDGAEEQLDYLTTDNRQVSIEVETEDPSSEEYVTFTLVDHDDYGGTFVTDDNNIEVRRSGFAMLSIFSLMVSILKQSSF